MRYLGEEAACFSAISPQFSAAGAVSGAVIDRREFESAIFILQTGATTGNPTSFSVTARIEDADVVGVWSNVTGATTALTAINSTAELNVNLLALRRYVRVVGTLAFVGGTAPTASLSSAAILAGARNLPV